MTTEIRRTVIPKDWVRLEQIINELFSRIADQELANSASPTFAGLTLTDLTVSRLIASDANKLLVSSDLVDWVAGTANRVTVADDADGTITLSAPQDIHTTASPTFVGITLNNGSWTIKDAAGNIVACANADEMYYVESSAVIVAGNPIGLLLALTYAA